MGITLGLLGGGGSILTVPILVYVLAVEPVLATGYSLFVVGATALVGTVKKHFEHLVAWRAGLVFAIPSLIAVFLTRYKLVPAIPDQLFSIGSLQVTKNLALMVFFALIMLLAAGSMINDRKNRMEAVGRKRNYPIIALDGLIVGVITGLVGAGGGFLIIPALVLLVGLPMKKAVGTSLLIIAVKSLVGFLGDVGSGQFINWKLLLMFTSLSILGMFVGIYLNRFASQRTLKKGFGWFVLIMAVFILVKELWM